MAELWLDGDRATTAPTIAGYLEAHTGADPLRRAAARAVIAIADAAGPVAFRLAQGELPGDPAHLVGTNTGGDQQKALDVGAHEHFLRALRDAGVQAVASEEAEEVGGRVPGGDLERLWRAVRGDRREDFKHAQRLFKGGEALGGEAPFNERLRVEPHRRQEAPPMSGDPRRRLPRGRRRWPRGRSIRRSPPHAR